MGLKLNENDLVHRIFGFYFWACIYLVIYDGWMDDNYMVDLLRKSERNVSNWFLTFFFFLRRIYSTLTGSWKLIRNAAYRWVRKGFATIWLLARMKHVPAIRMELPIWIVQNDRFILIEFVMTGEDETAFKNKFIAEHVMHSISRCAHQELSFSTSIYGIRTSDHAVSAAQFSLIHTIFYASRSWPSSSLSPFRILHKTNTKKDHWWTQSWNESKACPNESKRKTSLK